MGMSGGPGTPLLHPFRAAQTAFVTSRVVDAQDTILGVIRYNDIMKGVETRVKI